MVKCYAEKKYVVWKLSVLEVGLGLGLGIEDFVWFKNVETGKKYLFSELFEMQLFSAAFLSSFETPKKK